MNLIYAHSVFRGLFKPSVTITICELHYFHQRKIKGRHLANDNYLVFTARRVCIARTMPWQDVGLSVRLSVTRRYSVETAKHVIKDFHRLVAADHSSFSTQNGMAILRRGHPNGGVECKGV